MSDSEQIPPDRRQSGDGLDLGATQSEQELNVDLITFLLDQNIISAAQAQLLIADQEITGMPADEVLIARGWISEDELDRLAPWRKKTRPDNSISLSAGNNYQQNLKQYRALMEKILGLSWD